MSIGHNTRLEFDTCAYTDKVRESTAALNYRINFDYAVNKDACFSPSNKNSKYGASAVVDISPSKTLTPQQSLVDLESILTNRNVLQSKCKNKQTNLVDPTQFSLKNSKASASRTSAHL